MVSYDVTSRFTNIPLSEAIDVVLYLKVTQWIRPRELKLGKIQQKKLFFSSGCFYDQVDGAS